MVLFLSQMIPSLANIPTERMGVIKNVVASINSFAGSLLESARVEKGTDVLTDKSIIATLGTMPLVPSSAIVLNLLSQIRTRELGDFEKYE